MHRAGVAIVACLVAVMIAALRLRCSGSGWHVCSRAPVRVETAKQSRPGISAVLRSAEPLYYKYLQLGGCNPAPNTPKRALSLTSSRQFSIVPFASSSSNPDPIKSAPVSTFHKVTQLIKAAVQSLFAAALLLAAFPYLLSTKLGTHTASALASRVYPGDVKIERISLGWTQPISIEGVQFHEGSSGQSRQLFTFERMSSAEPLYAVCRGHGLTLTLTRPAMDCSLDDTGEQLRLLVHLQGARLRNLITGPTKSSNENSKAGGAAILQAQPQLQQQDQQAEHDSSSTAAAAPLDSSKHLRHSSGKKRKAVADVTSHPILTSADSLQQAEQGPPPSPPAAADTSAAAAAAAVKLSPLRQRLTQVDDVAHYSAEFRLPQIAVFVPDGQLLLPKEVKEALGPHIHAVAAAGTEQVTDLAEELDEDSSWLRQQQQQQWDHHHQQQQQQHESRGQSSAGITDGDAVSAAAAAAVVHWSIPPDDVSSRSWSNALPFMLQVTSAHVNGSARGWRLGPERYILQQPAQMDWEFTTELARLSLSQFNPVLEEVVSVREGGHVLASYTPTGGQLPATTGKVCLSPMKLQMGQGQLLKQIYKLLDISQSAGFLRRPWADTPRRVDVWTGPFDVTIEGPGRYKTSRTDMIIGSGASALHVAVWGSVNTISDTLDMRIGLPSATLAKAGIKSLPPSYVLPISVTGRPDKPQIDWPVAVRKFAVLSAMQLGRESWQGQLGGQQQQQRVQGPVAGIQQGLAGLFGVVNRALTNAASSFIDQVDQRLQQELQEVPPAAELPWQHQQQQQPGGSSDNGSAVSGHAAPKVPEAQQATATTAAAAKQQR